MRAPVVTRRWWPVARAGCLVIAAAMLTVTASAGPASSGVTNRHAATTHPCGEANPLATLAGWVCVHGDDPQLRGIPATSAGDGSSTRRPIPCHGDGTSSNRIAAYYAYFAGHPNRVNAVRGRLVSVIEQGNDIVYRSARQTGGARGLRMLTDAHCTPVVRAIQLPEAAAHDFGATVTAAERARLDSGNRKYLLFADTDHYCGLATLRYDDQPGVMNANNTGPSWARLDAGCWSAAVLVHEIMHMLGSVQESAPHFDGTGHCTDDHDLMCYQNPGGKRVYLRCTGPLAEQRLDCGHDDYFNTAPHAGSYLARHWDTARSSFLYGGGPAQPDPPGPIRAPSATMVSLDSAQLRWTLPAHSRVTRYQILKNGNLVWRGTTTAWTDPDGTTGQGAYQIRASNEAGAGPWSAAFNAVLPRPPAPTSVTAKAGTTTTISWIANSTLADGYQLFGLTDTGSAHYISSWPSDTRTADDNTLAVLKTWHHYRVCAYNAAGSSCRDAS